MDRDVHNLLNDVCFVFVKIEFDINVLERQ